MKKVDLENDEQLRNDIKVLKMRNALYSNRFYKKEDFKTLPKYFQVGQIVVDDKDFKNDKLTKKQ